MDNIQGKSMIKVNLRSLPCMGTVILCLVQAARPLCMQSPVRVISIVQAADESQSDRLAHRALEEQGVQEGLRLIIPEY